MPTMIPSTYEHVIYKGAMFINKDELKYTLDKLALMVKFEYRIKRSSKTRFRASCVDLACKFKLCASGMKWGNYWRVRKFVKDYTYDMKMFKNCP